MVRQQLSRFGSRFWLTLPIRSSLLLYPYRLSALLSWTKFYAGKAPNGLKRNVLQDRGEEGEKKKTGTKRIWQMDESEKPRRKTNGTTRPNTKAPRGRNRNGR